MEHKTVGMAANANDGGDVSALIEAGSQLAGIAPLIGEVAHPDDPTVKVPVAIVESAGGGRHVELLEDVLEALDDRRPGPRTRSGRRVYTEVDSFIGAVRRWATPTAVIYAQTAGFSFEAVLDDHPAGASGTAWCADRADYACPRSNEWKIWTEQDGKGMTQLAFAEFVESRLEDMIDPAKQNPPLEGSFPAPLDVLTMARNLQIFTKGTYSRSFDPTSGQYEFINKNENAVGSTVIHRAFLIAIPVFDGGERYQLEARIRFGLVEGVPRFSFTLHRRTEVERLAFDKVRGKVAAETKLPVFAGTP